MPEALAAVQGGAERTAGSRRTLERREAIYRPLSAPFAPGQVDTSSLVLSPLVVLEDCRGFVDSGSSLGPCMTPKVRFLDGVVCVLLLRGA